MVFSSATFLLLFLPIVFLINLVLPRKWSNPFLVIASLIFYGWGEPIYILLMIFSSLVNFILTRNGVNRYKLIYAVIFNIGLLGIFKYTDFFVSIINVVTGLSFIQPDISLPIGISFYTFQTLSYVIDVYRGEINPQKQYLNLLLYISFFPQLIAGPIVVYKDIEGYIINRRITIELTVSGIERFVIGLFKKLIIANTLAVLVDQLYLQDTFGTIAAWVVGLSYMMQIYFDFSGYSDMAIGLGRMFGFEYKENFNFPYSAQSIQDFWRRWHISLSRWFRDYVYIPLGGNRLGVRRELINKVIVFFLTGLWHGAAWTFVVWGLYHGLFLIIERTIIDITKLPRFFRRGYTLFVVMIGFILFRAESFHQAFQILKTIFLPTVMTLQNKAAILPSLTPWFLAVFIIGVVSSFPLLHIKNLPYWVRYSLNMVLWLICLLVLSSAGYNPFIYFRF